MNIADLFSIFERRKQFWDDFENKYAAKQAYENSCDYGILEFDKYWPGPSPTKNVNTQDQSCKQKAAEKEAECAGTSVLPHLDNVCDQENGVYSAKVDIDLQNARQHRKKSESTPFSKCSSPADDVKVNSDTQTSERGVKCDKSVNKSAVKHISKMHKTPAKAHSNLPFDVPIVAQDESDTAAVKLQYECEVLKSKPQLKNQHQMQADIRSDLNVSSGYAESTPSGTVKGRKECDINYSKIKPRKEITDGISGHLIENAVIFSGTIAAETAEVQQRCTQSQSKLREQHNVNLKGCKHASMASVCNSIPVPEVQREPFAESIKGKETLDTATELCSSPSISSNDENCVINEKRSNKYVTCGPRNNDSSPHPSKNEGKVSNPSPILQNCSEIECNNRKGITDGISGHLIENAVIFSGTIAAETAEVQQRCTQSQSKLREQHNVNIKGCKHASMASVCNSIPVPEVQREPFAESIKGKETLDTATELCSSPSISSNDENCVINEKRSNKFVTCGPRNNDSSPHPSKNEGKVSNPSPILQNCSEIECNNIPKSSRTASLYVTSLNNALQTGKSQTEAAFCASPAKGTNSNIMHLHQTSSKESSLVENDNDLHVIHQSVKGKANSTLSANKDNPHSLSKDSPPNSSQRNENQTNFKGKATVKHKAFMLLLANTTTSLRGFCSKNNPETPEMESSPLTDQFTQKSLVYGKENAHLQLDQNTETAAEKRCAYNCLAKQKVEGDYTFYSTRDFTANVADDVLNKLSMRSRHSSRKRYTRLVKNLRCKNEQQVLSHSLSNIRNFTEKQSGSTNKNEMLDGIRNGVLGTSVNHQCTHQLAAADVIRVNNHRQTENTKKKTPYDVSNSVLAKNSTAADLTPLGSNAYKDSNHSIEAEEGERCVPERLRTHSKTAVKLISQPCLSNCDESCLQPELSHIIKTSSIKHNITGAILKFNDKHVTKARSEKISATSNDITEQLCENVSEKCTNSPKNRYSENHRSNHDQQNKCGIIQALLTDSLLKMNNSAIKFKSKKLDISSSKADFCESNEIQSSKCMSNIMAEEEGTLSKSNNQHMEIQKLEEHKATENCVPTGLPISKSNIYCESNCSEKQSKPFAYERTNVQNKGLEKPISNPFFQVPCPPSSIRCSRNDSEAHNSTGNSTDRSVINGSARKELQNTLKNKSATKEVRKKIGGITDKQNKGDLKEGTIKSSKMSNFSITEKQKSTIRVLEHANGSLKELHRHKISGSSLLCAQGTLNGSKHEGNEVQVNIKCRKHKVGHKKDAGIDLTILESRVCNDTNCNQTQQQPNKYFAFQRTNTDSTAPQLQHCTPVGVECNSSLSSSECILSKMLTNFGSENWTTFKSRIVNDLQMPLPKKHKLSIFV